jgi:TrmH family RNA methyltransferase
MITSTKNPRIVEARKLAQRKHRIKQNRFLVEGLQLLTMAIEAAKLSGRANPVDVFYCEELFAGEIAPQLLAQLTELDAKTIAVAPNVLDTLSERDTSQGLAVTFALQELEWSLEEIKQNLADLNGNSLILILDKLQDPGNLGTLIRTADAVGVQAVILLEPCVDLFDPKTVRGTMGSLFTVPFSRVKVVDELWPWLEEMEFQPVGADAPRGKTVWESDSLRGNVALVLGNEARGLSPESHARLTNYVSLPLIGQAESLNVAVAGGVLMYEWLRVNQPIDDRPRTTEK